VRPSAIFHTKFRSSDNGALFSTAVVTAMAQTLLVREVFAVVGGNELVIGVMLAVWLAATAAGCLLGNRRTVLCRDNALLLLAVSFVAGMVAVRAVRLLLLPGAVISPVMLIGLLIIAEAPVAATGGYLFGMLAARGRGVALYRYEQAGSLIGFCVLAAALWRFVPNYLVAAVALLAVALVIASAARRIAVLALVVAVLAVDAPTFAWKYPLPVHRVVYAHEGETAHATVDDQEILFVNGRLHATAWATPAVEQAVHLPLGMHPSPNSILVINGAGHHAEAMRYHDADVRCIRLDRLIDDPACAWERLEKMARYAPFDAVILSCGMPDNGAESRFFTDAFMQRMHQLTGDAGIFSFTLPFSMEYADARELRMRDIIVTTLKTVFRHVKLYPGEELTFTASQTDYPFPAAARVPNRYFDHLVLAGVSPERIEAANREPAFQKRHTTAHPRLLLAALDRYLDEFRLARLLFVALPLILVALLLPWLKPSVAVLSVGTTGCCTGIYSVALILLFQSVYGTVYAWISLLLFSLSAGFAAGSMVKKLPHADLVIGAVLGGTLLLLTVPALPVAPLFFAGNGAAGFLAAAQFVTSNRVSVNARYVADSIGGVIGMALAATLFIPLFGIPAVAIGIIVLKGAVGLAAWATGTHTHDPIG
jgi:hypothetical protein